MQVYETFAKKEPPQNFTFEAVVIIKIFFSNYICG